MLRGDPTIGSKLNRRPSSAQREKCRGIGRGSHNDITGIFQFAGPQRLDLQLSWLTALPNHSLGNLDQLSRLWSAARQQLIILLTLAPMLGHNLTRQIVATLKAFDDRHQIIRQLRRTTFAKNLHAAAWIEHDNRRLQLDVKRLVTK